MAGVRSIIEITDQSWGLSWEYWIANGKFGSWSLLSFNSISSHIK